MIEKRWLDSLNDPDPEIRKQAVRAVINSGDEDAMKHLAKVYRNDADPEVREMARQGGIKLRQMGYSVRSESEQRYTTDSEDDDDEEVYDPGAGLYTTPLRDERPSEVDMTSSHPIDTEKHQKQKRPLTSRGELSWSGISPDLFLYFVIVTVGTFIVTTFLGQSLKPLLDDIALETTPQEIQAIRDLIEASTATMMFSSVMSGTLSVFTLIVQAWIIHYLATSSFSGTGNMFAFIRKYAIASAVLTVVIFGLSTFFIVTSFAAMPEMNQSTMTTTTTIPPALANLIVTLCCGTFFGLLGVLWYFGQMISRHYFIGIWPSIGSFVVAGIAAQIITEVVSNVIFSFI